MGFFSSIIKGVVSLGATVVGVVINAVSEFKTKVTEKIYELQTNHDELNKEVESKTNTVKDVNDEMSEYVDKYKKDGSLTTRDKERIKQLKNQRKKIENELQDINEKKIGVELQHEKTNYGSLIIDNDKIHIMQYHRGKTIHGKKCRKCGQSMILQWKRDILITDLSDLFWGCSGYFNPNMPCRNTEFLTPQDYQLFADTNVPEFEITNQEFNKIINYKNAPKIIVEMINNIKGAKLIEYICPIHLEPLVLKEKVNNNGLLDSYYLQCPRHDLRCGYKEKIKSAAQLSAVLKSHTGRGIF
jgi:hypothetical protein